MTDGKVLEFADVSMVFGDVPAVDGLSARIEPGRVTAFLGPNGAGKTTTLRILLGQLRPTRGSATIGGRPYNQIARPEGFIGSVLTVTALDKSRRKTVLKHLQRAAKQIGASQPRVAEVLDIVGLSEMGEMRIGSLSLGMKHRLAVAEAILANPGVLVFDEPANGLDPEGIRWIRLLMRRFADEGRTVLMSSHHLSEVEQVADALLVLNGGQLLFEGPIEELADAEGGLVTADSADRDALLSVLDENELAYRVLRSGIAITGTTAAEVGELAAQAGVALSTLTHRGPSLEDVYMQIIAGTWTPPARTAALEPTGAVDVVAEESAEPETAEPEPERELPGRSTLASLASDVRGESDTIEVPRPAWLSEFTAPAGDEAEADQPAGFTGATFGGEPTRAIDVIDGAAPKD
ncbi:ABC transporter ATP-binding protein [Microbacterium indicum]|uniref:ABC transporter ATP-binding protein n=1 Tax=Microbacterium indicum TaxID=358100 RepID=UPI000421625C|nr:ABC transporter ATP-binding protein [Microbacterium indicum]